MFVHVYTDPGHTKQPSWIQIWWHDWRCGVLWSTWLRRREVCLLVWVSAQCHVRKLGQRSSQLQWFCMCSWPWWRGRTPVWFHWKTITVVETFFQGATKGQCSFQKTSEFHSWSWYKLSSMEKIFVHKVALFSVMWIFDKQFCLIIQTWHTKCEMWGNSYKALFTLLSVDTFIFKACFLGCAALFVVISRFDKGLYQIIQGGHTACVL